MLLWIHPQQKITTELSKRVPKRDTAITRHHLKINRGKKYRAFWLHMGIERKWRELHNWLVKHPYLCGTRKCYLCLCEKLKIPTANSASLLNKRDELVSKCRHMTKFTLKCFKNRYNVILMMLFVNICSFRFSYKTNVVNHLMIG